ncbi:bifunctional metallophosphatase/5'-nucleotidase [Luteitalea sp.]|uniref:bifunctional metallophosphatase/5'-nucleotidase n=1 Tax=Luteitalea sp. TaxID=2004800 RepID=UPI000A81F18F|nr:bifunctional metallophosphatase/5'-nucleotidase [Luteitalea sp.]
MPQITLLQLNDLHGYLEPHPELFSLTPGAPWRSGGGLARIASVFGTVRRETGGAVVALDNGDTFHGSMPAVHTRGGALVAPMSALGLDAMTVHWELAYGWRQVKALASALPYPLLAANVVGDDGTIFTPFTIVERAGVRVGIIGLSSVAGTDLLPQADRGPVTLTIGEAAVNALVPRLRREHGVGLVVVLSHLGFPQDCKLASAVSGVDVILSGHSHHRLQTPVIVDDTLIMQSGAHGSFVGRLDLELSTTGVAGWQHRLIEVDDATEPDGGMQALVGDAVAPFAAARQRVLGTTSTPLTRYTMLESTMDTLLLAAVADSTDVPIALSNGWRYGAPIPPGPITEMDVWNIVPANPAVSVVRLTGAELRRLYEENLKATFACDAWQQRGGYVKRCRGLELAVKLENPPGERLQEIRVDGARLRANASYTVAFLGEQAVPVRYGADRRDTGVTAEEALRQYVSCRDVVAADRVGTVTLV